MEKLSKFRMRIFSTNRNYILSAESSDEMEAWITALQGSLAEHYTHEEMVEKAEAAEIMLPLIKEQTKMQNDLYQQQVNTYFISIFKKLTFQLQALAQAQLYSKRISGKVMTGMLDLLKNPRHNIWKRYRFILYPTFLAYYGLDDDSGFVHLA